MTSSEKRKIVVKKSKLRMSRPGLLFIFQFLLRWRLASPMNSLTGTSNPSRLFCARYGRFEQPQKGYALANHVIATYISIACPLDCSMECVADARCQSFNCAESGNKCELNDQRRETRPSDFGTRENATYFGPTPQQEGTGSGCMSVTCQHGGTCVDSCWNPQMFTCECRKDYEGVFCEKHSGVKTCQELKTLGENLDGVYDINPDGQRIINVFCDQTTDGGGWTVVQRRFSPYSANFERVWLEYKNGFGDLSGEFWLGNDNLHRLASSSSVLRIDLTANTGQTGYAKYGGFTVGDETTKFRWDMNSYQGNIGNRVYGSSHAAWNTRGMKFSAKDADNDNSPDAHCGAYAGWWFNWCGLVNLNRQAEPQWNGWGGITSSEMKVRKN